jgi:hypothetical protein
MEAVDTIFKFITSYPAWARILIVISLAVIVLTLTLVPRGTSDAKAKEASLMDKDDQAWLIVDGVDLYDPYGEPQIKLHINVNGTKFVYPTLDGVEWLGVGPTMASQQFSLPGPGINGYEIQMQMYVKGKGGGTYDLRSVRKVFVQEVPFAGRYNLHTVNDGSRDPGISASVRFHIGRNPNE